MDTEQLEFKKLNELLINCIKKRERIAQGDVAILRELEKKEEKKPLIKVKLYFEEYWDRAGPYRFECCPEWTVWTAKRNIKKAFSGRRYSIDNMYLLSGMSIAKDHETLQDCGVYTTNDVLCVYIQPPKINPNTPLVDVEPFETLETDIKLIGLEDIPAEVVENDIEDENPISVVEPVSIPSQGSLDIVGATAGGKPGQNEWICRHCTYFNINSLTKCLICQQPNLEQTSARMPTRSILQENNEIKIEANNDRENMRLQNYNQHLSATSRQIIFSQDETECMICMTDAPPGETVILQECLHAFCKDCLENHIMLNNNADVRCPYMDNDYQCESQIQEREIRALLIPDEFEKYLSRSLSAAEMQTSNSFHCKTPNCIGWCECVDTVNTFKCPVCNATNCLNCKAIHEGKDCQQYQDSLKTLSANDKKANKTMEMLKRLIKSHKAMHCPKCNVVIQKKDGCDWVQCSMCKLEICWVTRGPRWGEGGHGDTSGGCKCKVNGVKCHPTCVNCH
uniref:RanBP-type and C3HC4-type zinc finger-containing protein 1 n=1 Tax=Ciona intestinalis TaxID=7719 RepID=Q1RL70_CIOIN|nr:Zn-finger (RING/Ran-binding)-1 [Ciona intestinalis]FAA00195.1 TPA: zinc finger protein [Ciona intestinalis]|eukprot:NP_001123336.1 Zn-finger (RING/Ran-binding)-1 [Ciona intestinalis]